MIRKTILDSRFWKTLCSLKLAIVLASMTTVIVVIGSLKIPFNPRVFGSMDNLPLGQWFMQFGVKNPTLTWWVLLAGALVVALGANTLCCFIDWLIHIKSRWRKSGEYLIHLGFVLVLGAYLWGSVAGFRTEGNRVFVGESMQIPYSNMTIKLKSFEPVFNESGRPVDMISDLSLYDGEQLLEKKETRINHPLAWNGLVVLPGTFGRAWHNGQHQIYSMYTINYDPGAGVALSGAVIMGVGVMLTLFSFYRKRQKGDVPDVL